MPGLIHKTENSGTIFLCRPGSTKKPFKKGRENDFPALAVFLITALLLKTLNRENRNY